MKAALATALRESCGYLQDEGWHQTAQLMTLAADEIDRLNARVHSELKVSKRRTRRTRMLRASPPRRAARLANERRSLLAGFRAGRG